MSAHRKSSISHSTSELEPRWNPDKNALQLWKQKDRKQITFLFGFTQHLAHLHGMTTPTLNCAAKPVVNYHDDVALSSHDTLYQTGPAGCDAPLYSPVSQSVSQSLGVLLTGFTSSVLSEVCC